MRLWALIPARSKTEKYHKPGKKKKVAWSKRYIHDHTTTDFFSLSGLFGGSNRQRGSAGGPFYFG
jgi:hypothetical protein